MAHHNGSTCQGKMVCDSSCAFSNSTSYQHRFSQVATVPKSFQRTNLGPPFPCIPCGSKMTTQQMTEGYPNTASVLAIIGGCLMIVAGMLITALAVFVIPHLNTSLFHNATGSLPVQNVPSFVGSILTGFGLLGLISGIIVLGSGIMLRINPGQSVVFGLLILVFSVLSFFGSGGFVAGAVLGIIGGIMTLRWRRPAAPAEPAPRS